MSRFFILPILFCLFFVSCASVQQKQNKQIATLIHTQKIAFDKGRFDVAKKINNQLTQLVPAPKENITVHEFRAQTWGDGTGIMDKKQLLTDTTYTVLPENTDIKNLIINGSPQYTDLVSKDKTLQKTETDNNKLVDKLQDNTNSILIEKEKIVQKSESQGNIFSRIISFFKTFFGIGIIGTIIALIVCAFFAPQFIPLIFSFLSSAVNWFLKVVVSLGTGLYNFIQNIFKKKGS